MSPKVQAVSDCSRSGVVRQRDVVSSASDGAWGSAGSGGSVGGSSGNGGVGASSGGSGAGASSGRSGSEAGASGGVSGVGGDPGADASVDASGGANGSAGLGGTDAGMLCQPAGQTCVTSSDCCAPNTCGFCVTLGRSICAALVCQGQGAIPLSADKGGTIRIRATAPSAGGFAAADGYRSAPRLAALAKCPSGGCAHSSYCYAGCNYQCNGSC